MSSYYAVKKEIRRPGSEVKAAGKGIARRSAESWHIPTSDPPSGTIDVGSAASHEFGHVTALEPHFDDVAGANGSLCTVGDVNRHTMCAYYEPGTLRMRTLESHDIETFVNRYGR